MADLIDLTPGRAIVLAKVRASEATAESPLRLHGPDLVLGRQLVDLGILASNAGGFYEPPRPRTKPAGEDLGPGPAESPIARDLRTVIEHAQALLANPPRDAGSKMAVSAALRGLSRVQPESGDR